MGLGGKVSDWFDKPVRVFSPIRGEGEEGESICRRGETVGCPIGRL